MIEAVIVVILCETAGLSVWEFVFMSECVRLFVGVHVSESMFSTWGARCLTLNLVTSDCDTVSS